MHRSRRSRYTPSRDGRGSCLRTRAASPRSMLRRHPLQPMPIHKPRPAGLHHCGNGPRAMQPYRMQQCNICVSAAAVSTTAAVGWMRARGRTLGRGRGRGRGTPIKFDASESVVRDTFIVRASAIGATPQFDILFTRRSSSSIDLQVSACPATELPVHAEPCEAWQRSPPHSLTAAAAKPSAKCLSSRWGWAPSGLLPEPDIPLHIPNSPP